MNQPNRKQRHSAWICLLKYLAVQQALRLSETCKQLRKLCRSDSVWHYFCHQRWPEQTESQSTLSNLHTTDWRIVYRKMLMRSNWKTPPPQIGIIKQSGSRASCSRCCRPLRVCFCASLPEKIDNSHCPVIILQHPSTQTSIGTVQLLQLSLTHCVVLRGKEFHPGDSPELDSAVNSDQLFLLFPGPTAKTIDVSLNTCDFQIKKSTTCQITLIAFDSSWDLAKNLYRWNAWIAKKATCLQLSNSPLSIFGTLKKEPNPHCVSTVEAVSYVLGFVINSDVLSIQSLLSPALNRIVEIQKTFIPQKK